MRNAENLSGVSLPDLLGQSVRIDANIQQDSVQILNGSGQIPAVAARPRNDVKKCRTIVQGRIA